MESFERDPKPSVWLFLDESGTSSADSVTLIGATAFHDVHAAEDSIKATYDRALGDDALWPNQTKRDRFARTGFHFTEDSEDVRTLFLGTLRSLDFRAYAAYSRGKEQQPTNNLLVSMYGTLLRSVIARYSDCNLTVVFEQNSEMDHLYGKLWSVLEKTTLGASTATALRGSKNAGCLAATDYVLGVTRVHQGGNARPFETTRFAALGRNFAYLIDYDNDRHLGGARQPIL